MPHRHAVCYVVSDGYLLQTALSALQARKHSPEDVQVVVVHLSDGASRQADAFRGVLEGAGVRLVEGQIELLGGLHFAFARLFLPDLLPAEIDEILYLDGDTQIVGDLLPLLRAAPPEGGLIGVKDPMVFIHGTSRFFHDQVEGWWSESGIPDPVREHYINSGVLRIGRSALAALRDSVQDLLLTVEVVPRFLDQDLINRAMDQRVVTAGLDWNFPGFLLGTRVEERCRPRIIHFMSDPRPWEAPFRPWGRRYFEPYESLVRHHPELRSAWTRASGPRRIRYEAQQLFKHVTERPVWQSRRALLAVERMQRSDLPLD